MSEREVKVYPVKEIDRLKYPYNRYRVVTPSWSSVGSFGSRKLLTYLVLNKGKSYSEHVP